MPEHSCHRLDIAPHAAAKHRRLAVRQMIDEILTIAPLASHLLLPRR